MCRGFEDASTAGMKLIQRLTRLNYPKKDNQQRKEDRERRVTSAVRDGKRDYHLGHRRRSCEVRLEDPPESRDLERKTRQHFVEEGWENQKGDERVFEGGRWAASP